MITPGISSQPVTTVLWVERDKLRPNGYNPNVVAKPELRLLKTSILEDGWTMPIVVLPADEEGFYQIVDGYHRWTVSGDRDVRALTDGLVPVVVTAIDPVHRMMSTIRHNRARGQHVIVRMADIVKAMVDEGVSKGEIMARLQMEDEEVDRLACRVGLPQKVIERTNEFGRAWEPRASRARGVEGS